MGRTTTFALNDHVEDDTLLRIARSISLYRPPEFLDGPAEEDEDSALFGDHEVRQSERGYYRYSDEECRSRRVDLRGPTDLDPGPLQMQPGEVEAEPAVILGFEGQ